MAAVVPRLPAAKQRSEVSVKILKSPVNLLESLCVPLPCPTCPSLPQLPRLSYRTNRRCNISSPSEKRHR